MPLWVHKASSSDGAFFVTIMYCTSAKSKFALPHLFALICRQNAVADPPKGGSSSFAPRHSLQAASALGLASVGVHREISKFALRHFLALI